MSKSNVQEAILTSMLQSFKDIYTAWSNDLSIKHLQIPLIDNKTPRLSEQELKQIFIENFTINPFFKDYTYSVETPTNFCYQFTQKGKIKSPFLCSKEKKNGLRSANIDLTIYKQGEKIAVIEFKSNNTNHFTHAKDFFKLRNEPGENTLRFFVEIQASSDEGTLNNIRKKLFENSYCSIGANTVHIGFCLKHNSDKKCKIFEADNEKKNLIIKNII